MLVAVNVIKIFNIIITLFVSKEKKCFSDPESVIFVSDLSEILGLKHAVGIFRLAVAYFLVNENMGFVFRIEFPFYIIFFRFLRRFR